MSLRHNKIKTSTIDLMCLFFYFSQKLFNVIHSAVFKVGLKQIEQNAGDVRRASQLSFCLIGFESFNFMKVFFDDERITSCMPVSMIPGEKEIIFTGSD